MKNGLKQDLLKNPNIKIGEIDLDDNYMQNKKDHKVRVTTFIDGDIYEELNRLARDGGGNGRYQTLLNQLLRKVLFEQYKPAADLKQPSTKIASPSAEYVTKDDLNKLIKKSIQSEIKKELGKYKK